MAANFGELKTAVRTMLDRYDLDAVIPGYVNNAIARVNQELQRDGGIVDQEQIAYTSTVQDEDALTLPDDFDVLQFIKIGTDPLEQFEYGELIDRYADTSGVPMAYALFAGALILRPIPNAAYAIRIGYLKRYLPLTTDGATNWLITQGGNVLVYGACLEAAPQLGQDPRLSIWGASFKEAIKLILDANARAKRGPKRGEVAFDPALLAIGTGGASSILNGP